MIIIPLILIWLLLMALTHDWKQDKQKQFKINEKEPWPRMRALYPFRWLDKKWAHFAYVWFYDWSTFEHEDDERK